MASQQKGKLYICATPIGNLEDITLRCLDTLRNCDLIAAEDTRHTKKLLNNYQIDKPLTSYHEFNKEKKSHLILRYLENGQNVALVTDAGMPGICDPGYEIINLVIHQGFQIVPIPGASALTTALSVSGFNLSRFVFEGFIPKRKSEKEQFFENLKNETRTIVFYESPHRIKDSLKIIRKIMGNRKIAVNRELTKKFEEVIRGNLDDIIGKLNNREIKGEITLVLDGAHNKEIAEKNQLDLIDKDEAIVEKIRNYLEKGYYNKDIISLITREYNIPKNRVYQKVLLLKNKEKGLQKSK